MVQPWAQGGYTLKPVFTGIADLFFPAIDTFATPRIADFPGGANDKSGGGHVKIVTMVSPAPHSSVFMLEGPLTKVDSALGTDSRMNGYCVARGLDGAARTRRAV